MGFVSDSILALTRQLYPKGRAFKMPADSFFERLHTALIVTEAAAFSGILSILDSALPDNMNFTSDDASDWERRLGLIVSPSVPIAQRKAAIIRKINHPGTIKARQNFKYLEGQLQAAGFNVYVYENRFEYGGQYDTMNPLTLSGGIGADPVQYGDGQYGDFQYGTRYTNLVANHIDQDRDASFGVGDNLRSTFFIGGSPIGSFENVSAARKNEFRQLILRIKPAQTVAFLFINYI